jgi:5-methylcytosine-specific restriction endonuclease McrA
MAASIRAFLRSRRKASRSYERARAAKCVVADFTRAQWRELLAEHDRRCAYCGVQTSYLTRDHIVPLSRGGQHTKSNIVPACYTCNVSKGNRLLSEWDGPVSGFAALRRV